MKVLVLGGTWSLGRAVAEEAVSRGWEVSAFNRGTSGVIDTSASELAPRDVLAGAQ
jgi:uncharacterized protein YbjT (DUF2867 family)